MSSLQKFHTRTQPFKVNTLHTGTVSISGTATQGQVLTATNNIADADGLGTFVYQWNRTGTAISGATASTYTLVVADIGNTITVTITYTDGKGFVETETSAATAVVIAGPPTIGSGSDTKGYYVGYAGDGSSYMYVAPNSTDSSTKIWGPNATIRGTISVTDGLANTNTLAGFGETAHPAAYYCKNLTTGGYNTWYLPARVELSTLYANKAVQPFASANGFVMTGTGGYIWASTEAPSYQPGKYAVGMYMNNGYVYDGKSKGNLYTVRAVRRAI